MTVARAAVAFVVVAACGGHEERARRAGSAAPVELVAEPVYGDAGRAGEQGGAVTDEVEPNDSDDVATPLPLGAHVHGKLDPGDTDVDRYRIEVTAPGELAVFVGDLGGDASLDIEDATGNLLAHSDRDQRGGKVREGVPNLGVLPGRYYAVVRGKPKAKPPGKAPRHAPAPAAPVPPVAYDITAAMVAPGAGAEREPDDDRATATDVLVGDHLSGYLGWDHDTDVWKLSLLGVAAGTALDIDVGKPDGVAIELEIDDGIGSAIATRRVPRGVTAQVHGLVPVVPAGGSPFHYLTVRAIAGSNPDTAYELAVTAAPLPLDAEVEPDDTPDRAMAVAADRTVVHATWTPGDVDCFALPDSAASRTVDLGFDAPQGASLALDVLVDGKVVASSSARAASDRLTAKVPANGRVIARVRGGDATAGTSYDLHLYNLGL